MQEKLSFILGALVALALLASPAGSAVAAPAKEAPGLPPAPKKIGIPECYREGGIRGLPRCVGDVWSGDFEFAFSRHVVGVGETLTARLSHVKFNYDVKTWTWVHPAGGKVVRCSRDGTLGGGSCTWRMTQPTTQGTGRNAKVVWSRAGATICPLGQCYTDEDYYAVLPPDRYVVEGTVQAGNGAPIRNARVDIVGGGRRYALRTDANGHYDAYVEKGTYRVSAPGYAVGTCTARREERACVVTLGARGAETASFVELRFFLGAENRTVHERHRATTPLDETWVGDTLNYAGNEWDLAGGPVTLYWQGKKIATEHPVKGPGGASSGSFKGTFEVPDWTNGQCRTELVARQESTVRRVRVSGLRVARVELGVNAAVMGARKLQRGGFLCAGEFPSLGSGEAAFVLDVLHPKLMPKEPCHGLWIEMRSGGSDVNTCGVFAPTVELHVAGRVERVAGPTVPIERYDPIKVDGVKNYNAINLPPDYLDGFCRYTSDPMNPTMYVTGVLRLNGALLYVQGDLEVGEGIVGRGAVVSTGSIKLEHGRVEVASDSQVALVAGKKIVFGK